ERLLVVVAPVRTVQSNLLARALLADRNPEAEESWDGPLVVQVAATVHPLDRPAAFGVLDGPGARLMGLTRQSHALRMLAYPRLRGVLGLALDDSGDLARPFAHPVDPRHRFRDRRRELRGPGIDLRQRRRDRLERRR